MLYIYFLNPEMQGNIFGIVLDILVTIRIIRTLMNILQVYYVRRLGIFVGDVSDIPCMLYFWNP